MGLNLRTNKIMKFWEHKCKKLITDEIVQRLPIKFVLAIIGPPLMSTWSLTLYNVTDVPKINNNNK